MDKRLTSVIEGRTSASVLQRLQTVFPFTPPVLDISWGKGRFWKYEQAPRVIGLDRFARDPDIRGEWTSLPFLAASIGTAVFDPPHSGDIGKSSVHLGDGYGNASAAAWQASAQGYPDYAPVFSQLRRVLRAEGLLIVKAADMIHNHQPHWLSLELIATAQAAGFTLFDWIISHRQAVESGQWVAQHHARKNHAHWLIFVPPGGRVHR